MANLFAMLLLNFFAGANQGTSTSNCNTVTIKAYMNNTIEQDPPNYITSTLGFSQLIGAFIGSFSCTFLVDKLGPKWLVLICGALAALFQALCCIRVHWGYLFAMRALMGIPSSIITTVAPNWVATMATPKQRGILGVLFQLFICAGIIFAALILFALTLTNNYNNYWSQFLITAIISVMCTVMAIFLPDPKFRCGKKGGSVVTTDDEQVDNVPQASWKQLFTDKRYSKSILIAFFFPIGQQFTAINAVILYATITFQGFFSGVTADQSSNYGSLVVSAVNFVATCLAIPLVNTVGRKWLVIVGFLGVVATLIIFLVIYIISNTNPNKIALIVGTVLYLIFFEIGPGPCFYVCCSESFPREVRGRCLGIAFTAMQIANIIVVLIFPYFSNFVYGFYILCMIISTVTVIVLWIVMIETKGKSVEEIEAIMTGDARNGRKQQLSRDEAFSAE